MDRSLSQIFLISMMMMMMMMIEYNSQQQFDEYMNSSVKILSFSL